MEIITTIAEAAEFLGCSARTVKRMIERNEMPEPLQSKKDKYAKRFWTPAQLEPVKELIQKHKKYIPPYLANVSKK
jgi:transposase